MIVLKNCAYCGKELPKQKRRYCCAACRDAYARMEKDKVCRQCGESFRSTYSSLLCPDCMAAKAREDRRAAKNEKKARKAMNDIHAASFDDYIKAWKEARKRGENLHYGEWAARRHGGSS